MKIEIMMKYKRLMREQITKLNAEMDESLIHHFILPFSDRYKLEFISGNGTFFFRNKKGTKIMIRDSYQKFNTTFWKRYRFIENYICKVDNHTKFLGLGFIYPSE